MDDFFNQYTPSRREAPEVAHFNVMLWLNALMISLSEPLTAWVIINKNSPVHWRRFTARNAANGLTLVRLGLVWPLAYVWQNHADLYLWRFGCFAAIALLMMTDGLDGAVAREGGTMSWLGSLLDPVADRWFTLVFIRAIYLVVGPLMQHDQRNGAVAALWLLLAIEAVIALIGAWRDSVYRKLGQQAGSVLSGKVRFGITGSLLVAMIILPPRWSAAGFMFAAIVALFASFPACIHYADDLKAKRAELKERCL